MKKLLHGLLAAWLILALAGCTVERAQPPQGAQAADSAQPTDSAQAADDALAADFDQAGDFALAAPDQAAPGPGAIELTEEMYVTYINEIYTNTDDYLGRAIRLEGMFASNYYEPADTTYFYVYRVGPGCCGNDGSMCGFEFTWSGEMPQEDDWIEVTGTLDKYELEGQTYLTIKASSVEVKAERGAETVYR